jgi:hypothetical protein
MKPEAIAAVILRLLSFRAVRETFERTAREMGKKGKGKVVPVLS